MKEEEAVHDGNAIVSLIKVNWTMKMMVWSYLNLVSSYEHYSLQKRKRIHFFKIRNYLLG